MAHARPGSLAEDLEDNATVVLKEGSEHEGLDRHELDKDVERGAGGILEGIADGIASDGSLRVILPSVSSYRFLHSKCPPSSLRADKTLQDKTVQSIYLVGVGALATKSAGSLRAAGLDVLLGIVPSTAGVGGRDSDLRTATWQQ